MAQFPRLIPLPIPLGDTPYREKRRAAQSDSATRRLALPDWLMGPLSRSLGNDGQEAARLHELVEVESAVAVPVHLVEQV